MMNLQNRNLAVPQNQEKYPTTNENSGFSTCFLMGLYRQGTSKPVSKANHTPAFHIP